MPCTPARCCMHARMPPALYCVLDLTGYDCISTAQVIEWPDSMLMAHGAPCRPDVAIIVWLDPVRLSVRRRYRQVVHSHGTCNGRLSGRRAGRQRRRGARRDVDAMAH